MTAHSSLSQPASRENRAHAGQRAASARKKARRKENAVRLAADAEDQGVSVESLVAARHRETAYIRANPPDSAALLAQYSTWL